MVQVQSKEDYTAVVEQFSDLVYRIAYQNLMNTADAEDVVQDVFLRLLRHRAKCFADGEHLKAWLIRVTVNRCRDYRRMMRSRQESPLMEEYVWENPAREDAGALMEALLRMRKDERTILYLHDYEGYSAREIAGILGKNPNTVGSKLTRARKKLRMLLEEAGYECEFVQAQNG